MSNTRHIIKPALPSQCGSVEQRIALGRYSMRFVFSDVPRFPQIAACCVHLKVQRLRYFIDVFAVKEHGMRPLTFANALFLIENIGDLPVLDTLPGHDLISL